MAGIHLTGGALQRILDGESVQRPILQVLAYKEIVTLGQPERFRFILSDGVKSHQCCIMMGEALIDRLKKGSFEKYTVIQLNGYSINQSEGVKKVIILTDPIVVKTAQQVGQRIGTPTNAVAPTASTPSAAPLQQNFNQNRNGAGAAGHARPSGGPPSTAASPARAPFGRPQQRNSPAQSPGTRGNVAPINMLNPYQGKWTIKGRCTSKGAIRTWSKPTGDGKLFSFDLEDGSGGIRVTAFKEECDKFYGLIELGKAFIISRGQVKAANKKFTPFEHEMTLSQESLVELCEDDYGVPEVKYDFVKLAAIDEINVDTLIDVAGIVRRIGDVNTIMSQKLQKELKKRDITLVDDSDVEVNLTLWNNEAEQFAGREGSAIVAKKLKVSDFNGKSLGTTMGGYVLVDPSLGEADDLKRWYDLNKDTLNVKSLSNSGSTKGTWKLLSHALSEANDAEKVNFQTRARIVAMGRSSFYMACPGTMASGRACKKKVTDIGNGEYNCDACHKSHDNFLWRLIQGCQISDETADTWITIFDEDAQKLLNVTAEALKNLQEADGPEYQEKLTSANFTSHVFRLTARKEFYQDQPRIKVSANDVSPFDPVSSGRKMLALIKQFREMGA